METFSYGLSFNIRRGAEAMRRKWLALVLGAVLLLAGCSRMPVNPLMGSAEIDWVDFVKLGDHTYTGLYDIVLAQPQLVTEEVVGTVKFKVGDVVTNPSYRTKRGDAAFLPKGTKLYRVRGYEADELIAAPDAERIGGYRLFTADGYADAEIPRSYAALPKDRIVKIKLLTGAEMKPYKELVGSDKDALLGLLEKGADASRDNPAAAGQVPVSYKIVFFTDGPFALTCWLEATDNRVYFLNDGMRLIDDSVRDLLAA